MTRLRFGIWSLGFGTWDLISPPLGCIALHAASIATTAAVGELLERETTRYELTFQFRLARGARRAVFELVRRPRIAGAVHEEPRAPFRHGRANQPHRFGATHEQPDCFDEAGDQRAGVYPTGARRGNGARPRGARKQFRDSFRNKGIPVMSE
jgi:hypothetical protein